MFKSFVTLEEVIDLLNELLLIDRGAITNLIDQRVKCNSELSNHRTVQTTNAQRSFLSERGDDFFIGVLGLINGIFGIDENGIGPITVMYDGHKISEFKRSNPDDFVIKSKNEKE